MARPNDRKRLVIAWILVGATFVCGLVFAVTKNYILLIVGGILVIIVFVLRPPSITRLLQSLAARKYPARPLHILLMFVFVAGYSLLMTFLMTGHIDATYFVVLGIFTPAVVALFVAMMKGEIVSVSPDEYKEIGRIYADEESAMENTDEEGVVENTTQKDDIQ